MISKQEAEAKIKKILYNDHPLVKDSQGVLRFQEDPFLNRLFLSGVIDLNKVAIVESHDKLTKEDSRHLSRSLGYSVSGFMDLNINSTGELIKEVGFEVVVACEGREAVRKYFEGLDYDEIVLDIGDECAAKLLKL